MEARSESDQQIDAAQFMHDLAKIIGNKAIVPGKTVRGKLRDLPAWQIPMDAVQKGNNLQKVGERLEQMVIFLVGEISLYINVPHEDQAGKGQKLFFTSAELSVLHVALHDADKGLGIGEVGVGNFVKDHGIPGAHFADRPVFRLIKSCAGVALPPESTWA